jgi:hypothetical protein
MSLRIRLICLIALVLVLSLAVEGTIVSFNASRSVPTEINSALQVGQQIVKSALAGLPESPDPRRSLEGLVASFKGNRHLRVSLTGDAGATAEPSLGSSHFGAAPQWFVRLLGISPVVDRVLIACRRSMAAILRPDLRGHKACLEAGGPPRVIASRNAPPKDSVCSGVYVRGLS